MKERGRARETEAEEQRDGGHGWRERDREEEGERKGERRKEREMLLFSLDLSNLSHELLLSYLDSSNISAL